VVGGGSRFYLVGQFRWRQNQAIRISPFVVITQGAKTPRRSKNEK
jgi:hypothetical protein